MLIVDRIEGDLAVVEQDIGKFMDVPVASIEGDLRPGVSITETAPGKYRVDEGETAERAERIQKKARRLFT